MVLDEFDKNGAYTHQSSLPFANPAQHPRRGHASRGVRDGDRPTNISVHAITYFMTDRMTDVDLLHLASDLGDVLLEGVVGLESSKLLLDSLEPVKMGRYLCPCQPCLSAVGPLH